MAEPKKTAGVKPGKFFKGYGIWIGAIVLISAWTFLLGILVGRGTAPVHFDTDKLQAELIALRKAVLQKDAAELQKSTERVRFHEALKEASPPKPAVRKPVPESAPEPVPAPAPEPETKPAASAAAKPERTAAPSASRQDTAPAAPKRPLTIQVAALKESRDADRLVEDLQRRGYPAYKSIVKLPEKGVWFRVRIGSFASKTQAGETLERLKTDKLKGIVVSR